MSSNKQENPTFFLKDFILSLWCRQQALVHLLEEKKVLIDGEFFGEIEKELGALIQNIQK